MANYRSETDAVIIDRDGGGGGRSFIYGGGGNGGEGLGGIGAIIALVVVVAILWFLAREGKGNNDCHGGYYPPYAPYPVYGGGGNCCNSPLDCKIPMAPDMSNCEVDKDLWKVDSDIKDTVRNGDQAILDKLCASELKACERELAKAYAEKSALESKYFTEKEIGSVKELILKMDNQNDKQIAGIYGLIKDFKCDYDCNSPKRPPVYYKGSTVNTHDIDCNDYPRRRKCDDDCGCN